jgi:type IV secretion system protein VirD4
MNATKILWGQVLLVGTVVLAFIWAATKWTAWKLGFQSQLGPPGSSSSVGQSISPGRSSGGGSRTTHTHVQSSSRVPISRHRAASGGIAAVVVAITMSVWRAREIKKVTTYGSACWAKTREICRAGCRPSFESMARPFDGVATRDCATAAHAGRGDAASVRRRVGTGV